MLKFNTHRSQRYLRSRFIEGAFLLASEGTDIELELIDFTRALVRAQVGDIAVADAWKMERISQLEFRVKPGEAWFDGLPFFLRSSTDQLVSGNSLALGIVPINTTIIDDPNGTGKIITMDGSTPDDTYRVVIQAKEEVITNIDDEFIKNANLSEATGQKMRLNYTIHIVPETDQVASSIPYTGDSSTDKNLINEAIVQVGGVGSGGSLVTINQVTGSEQIDGRDIEVVVINQTGSNPIPKTLSDQASFSGGRLVDNVGSSYHIVSIFNDPSDASNQEVIRIDKEVDQPDPVLALNASYSIVKRDVFTTDDVNGTPTGKRYYPVSRFIWKQNYGLVHASVITDLRQSVEPAGDNQDTTHTKFDLRLAGGGTVTAEPTVKATGSFTITSFADLGLDTFEFRGVNFVEGTDFVAAGSNDATASALAQAINDSSDPLVDGVVEASAAGPVVTLTATSGGTPPNAYTISYTDSGSGVGATVSAGGTLTGGVAATAGQLVWGEDFEIINPHGVAKSIVASSDAVLLDGGALAYFLNYDIGSDTNVELGELAVTTPGSITTSLSLSGLPDLSQVKIGNTLLIEGTKESVGITAVDDINKILTIDSVVSGTGSAKIYLDTFAAGTLPKGPSTFVLAVKTGAIIQITNGIGLESGESTSGAGGVPQQLLDYVGSTGETDDSPNYASTTTVGQGDNLTTAVSDLDAQVGTNTTDISDEVARSNADRSVKLISGGTWSWDGTTLTWSADAYVSYPDLDNDRNTISAGSQALAANEVAYVAMNRATDALTVLTVSVANINAYSPGADDIVIARRDGADVIVGTHSFRLKTGEYLELDGALAEINRLLGQLKITQSAAADEVDIADGDIALLDGTTLSQELNDFLLDFSSTNINFTTGDVTGGVTGNDFTPQAIPVGEYFWYAVALVSDVVNADNRITAKVQITGAASSNAVQGSAPFPSIIGSKKLGAVLVQNNGGSIEVVEIRRLGTGSGSGGGSGSGDASSILTRMWDTLSDSIYDQLTGVDFSSDADAHVDVSSTGAYSLVSSSFEFDTIGKTLVTTQLLSQEEFLDDDLAFGESQLAVFWDEDKTDPAATYELSLDGGLSYDPITMERVGNASNTYVGSIIKYFAAAASIASEAVEDGDAPLDDATTPNDFGQQFVIAGAETLRTVTMKGRKLGSITGLLSMELFSDVAGEPGSLIYTATNTVDASLVGTIDEDITFTFNYESLAAGTYWLVITGDATYDGAKSGTDHIIFRKNSAGSGFSKLAGGGWTDQTEGLVHNVLSELPHDARLKITSSIADAALVGYGLFYDPSGQFSAGEDFLDQKSFLSDDDEFSFDLNFIPDPDQLKVYYVEAGQVFSRGSFQVSNTTVTFPAGTFVQETNQQVTLRFEQSQGTIDRSEGNANAIAGLTANGLQVSDLSSGDLTIPVGITLKRPKLTIQAGHTYTVNGTLVVDDELVVLGDLVVGPSGDVQTINPHFEEIPEATTEELGLVKKNKWQYKDLGGVAVITTATDFLVFTGLEIGKTYKYSGSFGLNNGTDGAIVIYIREGTTDAHGLQINRSTGTNVSHSFTYVFVATEDSIKLRTESMNVTASIPALNGPTVMTWATLEELNNYEQGNW